MITRYPEYFADYIRRAAELELLAPEMTRYDLALLGQCLKPARDQQLTYLGLQTLYDRYFIHAQGQRLELPQAFFMRVAMGLAINEIDRESRPWPSMNCYRLLTSCVRAPRCSMPAPCVRSCPPVTYYGARRPRRHLQRYQG